MSEKREARSEKREGFGALPEFWTAEEKEAAMDLPIRLREALRFMHATHRLRGLS